MSVRKPSTTGTEDHKLLLDFEEIIDQLEVRRVIERARLFITQRLDISSVEIAPLETNRASEALSEGVYRPDLSNTPALSGAEEKAIAAGMKSDILVPLIVRNEYIGTLVAASTKIDGISEDDRIALVQLAPRLAHALRNAGHFQALQEAHNKLARAIEEGAAQLKRSAEQLGQEIALRERAEDALQKAQDELEQRIAERTTEIERLKDLFQAENIFLREELEVIHSQGDIIGESTCIKNVIKQIDLVAPTDATVLILGESGTGKESIAREIHKRSRRADRPMIEVNCANMPRDLYESEFFGHVKGAFTGAVRDRQGRFEAAGGGTLFLDEVGEIPLELQAKLLRVLQEGAYERVGDTKTRKVDVRIIAATNRDLKQAVEDKAFREDLYYRLNVFPIEIAPLRSRKEDIPLLVNHFLDLAARRLNRPRPRLTENSVLELQRYDWPGNIRELQNVVERAVILSRTNVIHFDLPADHEKESAQAGEAVNRRGDPAKILTESEMRDLEQENIRAALSRSGGKIYGAGGAAELLGVKPTTLIARMKKMGITRAVGSREEKHQNFEGKTTNQ